MVQKRYIKDTKLFYFKSKVELHLGQLYEECSQNIRNSPEKEKEREIQMKTRELVYLLIII